jgi:hypothetical protein
MLMKTSRGRAVSGIASLAVGSSTFSSRSASSNRLATRKKIKSKKTMSIIGVKLNSSSALPRLIWTVMRSWHVRLVEPVRG